MMKSIFTNPALAWLFDDEKEPQNLAQVIASQYVQVGALEEELEAAEEHVEDLRAELRLNRKMLDKLNALAGKKSDDDAEDNPVFHL